MNPSSTGRSVLRPEAPDIWSELAGASGESSVTRRRSPRAAAEADTAGAPGASASVRYGEGSGCVPDPDAGANTGGVVALPGLADIECPGTVLSDSFQWLDEAASVFGATVNGGLDWSFGDMGFVAELADKAAFGDMARSCIPAEACDPVGAVPIS